METWPKNFKLIQYNELDSTNSEAIRLAFKDEINTCVFSRIQTNGKGSRGRKWISGSKNLTASFLIYPSGNFIEFSQVILRKKMQNDSKFLHKRNTIIVQSCRQF